VRKRSDSESAAPESVHGFGSPHAQRAASLATRRRAPTTRQRKALLRLLTSALAGPRRRPRPPSGCSAGPASARTCPAGPADRHRLGGVACFPPSHARPTVTPLKGRGPAASVAPSGNTPIATVGTSSRSRHVSEISQRPSGTFDGRERDWWPSSADRRCASRGRQPANPPIRDTGLGIFHGCSSVFSAK
jgi:hypothetical protein